MISMTRTTCVSMIVRRRVTSSVRRRPRRSRRSSSRCPATECSGVPTSCATSAIDPSGEREPLRAAEPPLHVEEQRYARLW